MIEANNLDWKTYESITKYIYETLGEKTGVKIKGYGNTCKVIGKSGVRHQIDVLTSHSDGIHNYETAIECKYWKEKINKDIVMKVSEIIEDTNINKGVIVSKNGFTQDGLDYAKYRNIGLVELREIHNKDLDGKPKEMNIGDLNIHTSVLIRRPVILFIEIGKNHKLEIKDEFEYFDFIITLENGNQLPLIDYVNNFRQELNIINKEGERITKYYKTPKGVIINRRTNTSVIIDVFSITGQLIEIDASRKVQFTLVDKVWLIMKSIFDERTFTFSENGLIIEHKM